MSATQKLLRFGVFELNLDAEELRKYGSVVKLPPQPLKLLALLASQAGQVVSRDQIQQELWQRESEVDVENMVNKCIKHIRATLSDNADHPLYIETLPRQGYRFIAPVVSKLIVAPGPRVVQSESGERERAPVLAGGSASAPAIVVDAVAPSYLPDSKAAAPAPEVTSTREKRHWFSGPCLAWIGLTVLLVVTAAGGIYWRALRPRLLKAPVLTDKDTIVLADFDNKTGDPVFDDTLKQGLAIQLEQSPFLELVSLGKVNQTLKLMGRSASDTLTPDVAREVCQRTDSKAMLMGSIAAMGSQYVIGLEAVSCDTGDVLAEVQEQATSKEAVLKALDAGAVSLRSKLGESLSSVQKYATPMSEATTSSLEALRAYSLGKKIGAAKGEVASLPFFEHAVELDPNFALAYGMMAVIHGNFNEVGRAAEYARKAYALRGKVSERERLAIESYYYLLVTGEVEKQAQVDELWRQTYPNDVAASGDLAVAYAVLGNLEKASQEQREAMRLEPNDTLAYINLGTFYMGMNRLDEADALYKQAAEHKLDNDFLIIDRYLLAFLTGDTAQMGEMAAAAMGKPGTEDILLAAEADTEAWHGRLQNARELTRRAMDSAERNDAKETAAAYQAAAALREVESGNPAQARADADAAIKLAPNRQVRVMAALALARAGDTARAEKLAAELDKGFPLDTLVQRYWLPAIRASVALQQKDPKRAVELLKPAGTIEMGLPAEINTPLCPAYVRGEAYLMLHDGQAAAAEFEKFTDHSGLVVNFPWGALARLGLARAYALSGDTTKAKVAYQNFLSLWEDADPDIPIYRQAKAEDERLR